MDVYRETGKRDMIFLTVQLDRKMAIDSFLAEGKKTLRVERQRNTDGRNAIK